MPQSYRILDAQEINGISTSRNYITNGHSSVNTSGWLAYKDAAATSPVDGTGGSPAIAISRSTSSPLRGVASFLLTTTAANLQGEGVSYDFTIDSADQASVLSVAFTWSTDVTTSTGDFVVYIYDVTNAALIQPAGYQILGGITGNSYKHTATFQTASNSTSYRLIIHRAVTTAMATNLKLDCVSVGPQITAAGAAISDWAAYTPTVTNGGTTSANTGMWRRVGDSIQIQIRTSFTGAGSGVVTYSIPSGLSIDTARLSNSTQYRAMLGSGMWLNSGTDYEHLGVVYSSTTAIAFQQQAASAEFNGTLLATGDNIYAEFMAPIVGWSSNSVMSSDTDTRVVAARYETNTAESVANSGDVLIDFEDKVFDTHGAVTIGASWKFTAPVSGVYRVTSSNVFTSSTYAVGNQLYGAIYKGGVANTYFGTAFSDAATAKSIGVSGSALIQLNAGEYIDVRLNNNRTAGATLLNGTAASNFITIERLSGPATIAASESVNARYTSTSAQAITTGNSAIIGVGSTLTKVYDSHSFVSTAGVATIPVSGKYRISAALTATSVAYTAGSGKYAYLSVTGSQTIALGFVPIWGSITSSLLLSGQTEASFNAGDTISITVTNQSGSTFTLDGSAADNWITISRIGN